MRALLVLLFFLPHLVFANPNLADVQTYYINGVNTEQIDAMLSARRLATELGVGLTQVRILYNPTETLFNLPIEDFIETNELANAAEERQMTPIEYLIAVIRGALDPIQTVEDYLEDDYHREISELPVDTTAVLNDWLAIIDNGGEILGDTFTGRNENPYTRFLLVGHSQGTLFANRLYSEILATQAALTPMCTRTQLTAAVTENVRNGVVNNAPAYVTNINDLVVLAAGAFRAGAILNANTPGTGSTSDSFGHSFVDAYMTQSSLRNAVISQIENLGNQLQNSCNAPPLDCPAARMILGTFGEVGTFNYMFDLPDDYQRAIQFGWSYNTAGPSTLLVDEFGTVVTTSTPGVQDGDEVVVWTPETMGRTVTLRVNNGSTQSGYNVCVSCDTSDPSCSALTLPTPENPNPPPPPPDPEPDPPPPSNQRTVYIRLFTQRHAGPNWSCNSALVVNGIDRTSGSPAIQGIPVTLTAGVTNTIRGAGCTCRPALTRPCAPRPVWRISRHPTTFVQATPDILAIGTATRTFVVP